jgi:DNA-directed RNA polymerase III subunit RPC4
VSHMPTEMTASGPFAMGPATAGSSGKRIAPRNNVSRTTPQAPQLSASGPVHSVRKAGDNEVSGRGTPSDVEVYSDPDDGVEVIDMDNVRELDWVAPESLVREKRLGGRRRRKGEDKSDAKASGMVLVYST